MTTSDCSRWIFPGNSLENPPSVKLGMTLDQERKLRQKSCLFIIELGKYLQCNHVVLSAATIMFHRFFMAQAFQQHDRFIICATCVFLAGKVEESPKRIKDVVDMFLLIRKKIRAESVEAELKSTQDKILVAERILLQTLEFDLQINHPYGNCMDLLKSLKLSFPNEETRKEVRQSALNFLTDSFGSVICIQYTAELIATAAAFLATLKVGVSPPVQSTKFVRKPGGSVEQQPNSWYDIFVTTSKVSEQCLKSVCDKIIDVYEEKKFLIDINNATTSNDVNVDSLGEEAKILRQLMKAEYLGYNEICAMEVVHVEDTSSVTNSNTTMKSTRSEIRPPPPPPANIRKHASVSIREQKDIPVVELSKTLAPSTPDILPPPTPEYLPPPGIISGTVSTIDFIPPPTPDYFPPPTPNCTTADTIPAVDLDIEKELTGKRNADTRDFKDQETSIESKRCEDSSPPKKYKI
jgi:hypothetical protein